MTRDDDQIVGEALRDAHRAMPAPEFAHVMTRARASAKTAAPWRPLVAAAATVGLVIAAAVLFPAAAPPAADPLAGWTAPSDFLLRVPPAYAPVTDSLTDVPGAEFLRAPPSMGATKSL